MTQPRLVDDLPRIYDGRLPPVFSQPGLHESFATCDRCAMVPRGDSNGRNTRAFRADRKCCTFFPNLPNYLVGSLLFDGRDDPALAEGRRRVLERIEAGLADPLGMLTPQWYTALYRRFRSTSFGKSKTLLCPYFERDRGTCTIWRHRDAVCSTYFCKSTAGKAGKDMWAALRSLLLHVQTTLMLRVMQTLGWSGSELIEALERLRTTDDAHVTPEELDGERPAPEHYERRWGSWAGREVDFFERARQVVLDVSWAEVDSWIGLEGHVLLQTAVERRQLALQLPHRFRVNPSKSIDQAKEWVRVDLLPQTDVAFDVPVEVLTSCSGRSPESTIQHLCDEHGLEIDIPLLRTLFQHDWLQDADTGPEDGPPTRMP